MTDETLRAHIETLWEERDRISSATVGKDRDAIETALEALDSGRLRVAAPQEDGWVVHEWLKKAVLLSFRLNDSIVQPGGAAGAPAYDKVPLKFAGWDQARFDKAGFRVVPGAVVRRSAFIAPGAVLMPSFVNVGARVDSGTMVDTWATVGSCAQIGKNCHISGGAGIGGVLEPLQAAPVIIEDNCFIGARSEVLKALLLNGVPFCPWVCSLGLPPRLWTAQRAKSTWVAYRPILLWCRAPCRLPTRLVRMVALTRHWPVRLLSSVLMSAPAPKPPSTNCCATKHTRRKGRD